MSPKHKSMAVRERLQEPAEPSRQKDTSRLTVDLNAAQFQRLDRLSDVLELENKSDVVRFALKLIEYLAKAVVAGYKIELVRGNERKELPIFVKEGPAQS